MRELDLIEPTGPSVLVLVWHGGVHRSWTQFADGNGWYAAGLHMSAKHSWGSIVAIYRQLSGSRLFTVEIPLPE